MLCRSTTFFPLELVAADHVPERPDADTTGKCGMSRSGVDEWISNLLDAAAPNWPLATMHTRGPSSVRMASFAAAICSAVAGGGVGWEAFVNTE